MQIFSQVVCQIVCWVWYYSKIVRLTYGVPNSLFHNFRVGGVPNSLIVISLLWLDSVPLSFSVSVAHL